MRIARILVLAMLLTACGAEGVEGELVPYEPIIQVVEVSEGDRSMHCAVYYRRLTCNWDAWNE